jgi:hypothetical protein
MTSRANTLTEIWDTYSTNILSENVPGEKAAKFGTKPGKGPADLNSDKNKKFQNGKSTGPDNAEGLKEPIDPKKSKKKDELYDSEKFSSQNYNEKVGKKIKESINNNMKSTFDKLFESVMSEEDQNELEALGIDAGDEGDVEVEETDEITLTLDRETAQKLHDMLMDQLSDEDEGEDEGGFEAFGAEEAEEDDDEELEEATELKEVPASAGHSLTSRKNTVGTVRASGGKAQGSLKKVGNGEGHDLPDSAGHKLQSKKAVVSGKAGKTGDLFA